jgi:two-component system response regulator RegX3
MNKIKLLIVEDEQAISQGLVDLFTFHGYEVKLVEDGEMGLEEALSGQFDLVLLDVMLPKLDGFSVCNHIRKRDREQPIIMLTAKSQGEDVENGLTLGADDYITKPFSVRQLVLRVEAVLRRSRKLLQREVELDLGQGLIVNTENLTAKSPEVAIIELTRREVELLQYLYKEKNRPVPREELLVEVWGYHKDSRIETRTVDIHMTKLRKKIENNPKDPQRLVTVRGEGYRWMISEGNL